MLSIYIDDYLEYIERELGCTPKTVYGYKYQFTLLLRSIGDIPVANISFDTIQTYFMSEEKRGLSVSSVNTARAVIRSFFYYLQYRRQITIAFDSKMIRNKKAEPAEVRVASADDLRRALNVLKNNQDKLIVLVLSQTCMRVSELVKLRVEHIDGCEIKTLGKGRKPRPVSITPELAEALAKHMSDNKIYAGPVFVSSKGKAYTISGLRNRFIRRLQPHGIYAGFHWYRHGGATDMMKNGADLFFIREYLGHSDIRTTQRYLHLTDKDKHQKFQSFYKSPVDIAKVLT